MTRISRIAAAAVLALLPALEAKAQLALPTGDPEQGRAFALGTCTPCHVVASGQATPQRFAIAPSFRTIATTPGMSGMKLQAVLSTPHAIMPSLILTPEEMADVIAYIISLRGR